MKRLVYLFLNLGFCAAFGMLPITRQTFDLYQNSWISENVSFRKNAVCLIGKSGHPAALSSVQVRLLEQLDAELFIVSPTVSLSSPPAAGLRSPNSEMKDSLLEFFNRHSPSWSSAPKGNSLGGLPGFNEGHGAFQLRDRFLCAQKVSETEVARAQKYKYVGVGRLDIFWLENHPHIAPHGCWIPCETNDWGGVCDHWAWCERTSAFVYLKAPLLRLPEVSMNTERHLRDTLDHFDVNVTRGTVAFVRSCTMETSTCALIEGTTVFAKTSGEQAEISARLLLASSVNDILHETRVF